MPLITTFASLSINGFKAVKSAAVKFWLSAQSVYPTQYTNIGTIKVSNGDLYMYGSGDISSTVRRPFAINISKTNGSMINYLVLSDITTGSISDSIVKDMVVDGNGNRHLLVYVGGYTKLLQYNSAGAFVTGTILSIGGFNLSMYTLDIGASNILYLSSGGSIVKILTSTPYIVLWTKQLSTSLGNYNSFLIDSVDNLIMIAGATGSSPARVIKLDNTGSILWQVSLPGFNTSTNITSTFALDNSNNIIGTVSQSSGSDVLIKLDSSTGSLLASYQLGSGISYSQLTINGDNNIVLGRIIFPGSNYETYVIDSSSFTVLYSSSINLTSVTNGLNFNGPNYDSKLISYNDKLYLGITFNADTGGGSPVTYKCTTIFQMNNNNNNYGISMPFSFTINTGQLYSGTLTTTSITNPSISSVSYSISTTSYTNSNITVGTTTTTQTLGSTVPFNYNVQAS